VFEPGHLEDSVEYLNGFLKGNPLARNFLLNEFKIFLKNIYFQKICLEKGGKIPGKAISLRKSPK